VSTAAAVASVPAAAPSGTPVQTGRRVRLAALGKGLHLEGDRFNLPCVPGPRHRGIPAVFSIEENGSSVVSWPPAPHAPPRSG
jgi:hypothetical protein